MNQAKHPPRAAGAFALLVLLLLPLVHGHGVMVRPRARGSLHQDTLKRVGVDFPDAALDVCPHCLNGAYKYKYPANLHPHVNAHYKRADAWVPYKPLDPSVPFIRRNVTLCGDRAKDGAPHLHDRTGLFGPPAWLPYSATYEAGAEVEFEVAVTTSHNGFWEFFVCDAGACGGDLSEACFREGHCRALERAPVPACEAGTSRECGPIDPAHPTRWVMPCRKGPHVGEYYNGGPYMRYKLPEDFTCDHCVLQWYWASANRCNPPGFIEYFEKFPMHAWDGCPGDSQSSGARRADIIPCGPTFAEEFFSCADVRITAPGAPPPPEGPANIRYTRKETAHGPAVQKSGTFAEVLEVLRNAHPLGVPWEQEPPPPRSGKHARPAKGAAPARTPRPAAQVPGVASPPPSPSHAAPSPPHAPSHAPSPIGRPTEMRASGQVYPGRTTPSPQRHTPAPSADVPASPSRAPRGAVRGRAAGGCSRGRGDDDDDDDDDDGEVKRKDVLGHGARPAGCARKWGQCGGRGFRGSAKCCDTGVRCKELNPYFFQCL